MSESSSSSSVSTTAGAADDESSDMSTAAESTTAAAAAGGERFVFRFEGMRFTVTERNKVAQVVKGGGVVPLGGHRFFDPPTGTWQHFVDVQGPREAMLLLVTVHPDQPRILGIRRF